MSDTPTIEQRLCSIAAEVEAVAKDRNAQEGDKGAKYKFRGYDDVVDAVHPLFAKHGVVIAYNDLDISWDRSTRGGGGWRHYLVRVEWRFTGEDGSVLTCISTGEGLDGGDKGLGKARSYALRDVLTRMLTMPTNDPTQDAEAHDLPPDEGMVMVKAAKAKGELLAALQSDTAKAAELWPFGTARFVSRDDLDDLLGRVSSPVPMAGEGEELALTESSGSASPPEAAGDVPSSPAVEGPAAVRAALKDAKP